MSEKPFKFKCTLSIKFPRRIDAERTMKSLEVDEEPSNKITKLFKIKEESALEVTICATEAKMLRVGVSSFCDFLRVALLCLNEFS